MTTRVAMVTGCSSGIGLATAKELARRGWQVAATARQPAALEALGVIDGVTPIPLDVCDHDSIIAAVKETTERLGPIDVLVNNAGYALLGPVEEVDLDAVRRQFETNVFGLLDLTQQVLPSMRARRSGRIVNISSTAGYYANPLGGVYAASKFAVEAISDALRVEVAPFGVNVVVIEPGPITTRFTDRAHEESERPQAETSPYRPFEEQFEETEGKVGWIFKSAEHCARVVADAVEAARPKVRYRITLPAHALPVLKRALPDRMMDAFTRKMLGIPKRANPLDC
jgi:NAD(P)-dependent dehydrogenase (short-subunit alcohol dehydrogenase family)